MTQRILIIGATSAIAQSVAKIYASQHAALFLVGRNTAHLNIIKDDLVSRGAEKAATYEWNAGNIEKQQNLIDAAKAFLGALDIVLIAYGSLPDQTVCENSVEKTIIEINVNGLSVVALLTALANEMLSQGAGTIAVISSVAGDRGRQSNYVYGAAKALLSTFLQGLRARLYKKNIQVLTIKPGFVDTPMTQDVKKNFLFASSEK
ncbi:MAG: SDR family NAD(P)-dependent oxidoreductase, partial [Gammaproteobacteria bacterium]|nr:SDR family NAD(P)-dependent oxidoreductase [Gammaproteobacteria bacterium]